MDLYKHLPLDKPLHLQITRQQSGSFVVTCADIPEFLTEGATLGEALHNSADAFALVDQWYGDKQGVLDKIKAQKQDPTAGYGR